MNLIFRGIENYAGWTTNIQLAADGYVDHPNPYSGFSGSFKPWQPSPLGDRMCTAVTLTPPAGKNGDLLCSIALAGQVGVTGITDAQKEILPSLRSFVMSGKFLYMQEYAVGAIETDISEYLGTYSFEFSHQLRVQNSNGSSGPFHTDYTRNSDRTWQPTGLLASPRAGRWNKFEIRWEASSVTGECEFVGYTLNHQFVSPMIDCLTPPVAKSPWSGEAEWYGLTANLQINNANGQPLTVYFADVDVMAE